MDLISIKEIIIVIVAIIFASFISYDKKKFQHRYNCLKPQHQTVIKITIVLGLGLLLGSLAAFIFNYMVDEISYIPYHDNISEIVFDALTYLLFITPFVFIAIYLALYASCSKTQKRNIAFYLTSIFLLNALLLVPTFMARINISYDISNPQTEEVSVFDKTEIHDSRKGPHCLLTIGPTTENKSTITLAVDVCEQVEKSQKLTLSYHEGYLGYKWISDIR